MRLQNQQNMIFGWNSYRKSLNRIGNLEKIYLCENHSWRSPAHSEGPQTPKTCFWAWIRSLKPQKHPWMARWHSNSWIVSLNISRMQTGQDFRDIQLGFPGRPQVVFNRFTDSHPNPASRPQAPPDLVIRWQIFQVQYSMLVKENGKWKLVKGRSSKL